MGLLLQLQLVAQRLRMKWGVLAVHLLVATGVMLLNSKRGEMSQLPPSVAGVAGGPNDPPATCASGLPSAAAAAAVCPHAVTDVPPPPSGAQTPTPSGRVAQQSSSAPAFSHLGGDGGGARGGVPGAAPADRVTPTPRLSVDGRSLGERAASSPNVAGRDVIRSRDPASPAGGTANADRRSAGGQSVTAAAGTNSGAASADNPETAAPHRTHSGKKDSSDAAAAWVRARALLLPLLLLTVALACAAGQC
ncbi:uncharacterized protein Tco025E_08823 [Trypanosoma conorhini]|uniref:Uncharacterized protein n=1 Tax=Trypanosoma conorhini TaxID=83891 RepID=A0A422N4C5_9TRYP|nr:uncharacterized protein Tco025E_08823 [Trypanosoma conorhini]RNF00327.1 hypothetical protein Tco025E_08823 [Trypanosoma conorhini]